jgi:hypothetical protein
MDEIAGGLSVLALGFAAYSLVLTNRGPAVGQDVDVDLLDTKTEGGLPELSKDGHTFPLTRDAGRTIASTWSYGDSPHFRAALRWKDGRGQQIKTLTLSLF